MTYFQDLTPCDYGRSFSRLRHLVAVGWLEPPFDFPRGTVQRAMRDRLEALFSAPWSLSVFMGSHACRFCVQVAGIDPRRADVGLGDPPRGSTNILIPGRDVVYVIPELILHYIDEHQYCPPSAFARAVGACPPLRSKGYFLALMSAGGNMPAFIEELDGDAARQAVLLWRNPLWRAWYRIVRSLADWPARVARAALEGVGRTMRRAWRVGYSLKERAARYWIARESSSLERRKGWKPPRRTARPPR